MGLFSFSQYGFLNESQRLRLRTRRPAPSPSKGTDRYNLKRASFVSMMCIRAVVRPVLLPMVPRTDTRCSADKSPSTLRTVGANSGGWATGAEAHFRRIAHDAATPPTPQ